uniref:LOW QUALITY PROTEIN: extensin-1 n=1 Tax=Drosophila rhopaloa TaxID=1041015 RepID=A0A6P4EC98_DRORH
MTENEIDRKFMGVVLRELRCRPRQRRQQQPVNQPKQTRAEKAQSQLSLRGVELVLSKMKFLIAFALVAVASADVSHLFSHSNNLQEDGYHYSAPRAPVVIDVPYVQHESAPVVVYEAPKPRPTPARPVYTAPAVVYKPTPAPVVYHPTPAGILKDDGYHYAQPSVKFEVKAPPPPKVEYLPPPPTKKVYVAPPVYVPPPTKKVVYTPPPTTKRAYVAPKVEYLPPAETQKVVVYTPPPPPPPKKVVYTPPPTGILKDDGYHYAQPSIQFEVKAPAPVYVPPPPTKKVYVAPPVYVPPPTKKVVVYTPPPPPPPVYVPPPTKKVVVYAPPPAPPPTKRVYVAPKVEYLPPVQKGYSYPNDPQPSFNY